MAIGRRKAEAAATERAGEHEQLPCSVYTKGVKESFRHGQVSPEACGRQTAEAFGVGQDRKLTPELGVNPRDDGLGHNAQLPVAACRIQTATAIFVRQQHQLPPPCLYQRSGHLHATLLWCVHVCARASVHVLPRARQNARRTHAGNVD